MFNIFKYTFSILDKNQKKTFRIILFLSFVATLLETLSIASILPLVSTITSSKRVFFSDKLKFIFELNNFSLVLSLFVVVFFLFTLKSIFLIYYEKIKTLFIEDVKVDQSNNLFLYYLNQPFTFHVNNNSSKLIRNLNESQSLGYMVRTFVEVTLEILVLIGLLTFLIFLELKLTLICIIIFGIFATIFYQLITKRAQKWGEERQRYSGLKLKELQQGFGALRDIKILNKQDFFSRSFSDKNSKESINNYKNTFFSSMPKILFEWVTVVSTICLIFFIYYSDKNINDFILIMTAFVLAAYRLIPSVVRILNANQALKYLFPIAKPYIEKSLKNKYDLLSKKFSNSISDTDKKNSFLNKTNNIFFKNVSFSFLGMDNYVLKNINLSIKANEFIGIFGDSGSGKTTLINLLLGLYKPTKGEIVADEINIFENLFGWRKMLSFIPQNVYIIDDTINNNVAFGHSNQQQDKSKIIESLAKANALEFVKSLKNGPNTNCGELGELLSGGQRQRLAIARAFYNNAQIFIFDEFTSFLDVKNEEKIMKEISDMKNKTRIIVSHNIKILKFCNRVFEIKNKSIEEKKII